MWNHFYDNSCREISFSTKIFVKLISRKNCTNLMLRIIVMSVVVVEEWYMMKCCTTKFKTILKYSSKGTSSFFLKNISRHIRKKRLWYFKLQLHQGILRDYCKFFSVVKKRKKLWGFFATLNFFFDGFFWLLLVCKEEEKKIIKMFFTKHINLIEYKKMH